MKTSIMLLSILNMLFMFMHEFDAMHKGEWKMFKFLKALDEKMQYDIFLYAHVPFTLIYFYYFYTLLNFNNFYLWVVMNLLSIAHLVIHLVALTWKSNVFKTVYSYGFMAVAAICGALNLLLLAYY